MTIGSHLTLDMGGEPATVTIVGKPGLAIPTRSPPTGKPWPPSRPDGRPNSYGVQLTSGASVSAYLATVRKAAPGLNPQPNNKINAGTEISTTTATLFAVLLAIAATLGVFNTVLLSTANAAATWACSSRSGWRPAKSPP